MVIMITVATVLMKTKVMLKGNWEFVSKFINEGHTNTHILVHIRQGYHFGTITYVQGTVASGCVTYEHKLHKQLTERMPTSSAIRIHLKLNPTGVIKRN
jgi:hypothetical protein